MKKISIILAILMACVSSLNAQQTHPKVVDFTHLPSTTFPCVSDSIGPNYSIFTQPLDLSIYCSTKAQSSISAAQTTFVIGTALSGIGGCLIGYAQSSGDDEMLLVGAVAALAGGVCEVVSIGELIAHWKWEYRRKQVDLYLNPNGATLRF